MFRQANTMQVEISAILAEPPPSLASLDADEAKLWTAMKEATKALESAEDAYRNGGADARREPRMKVFEIRQELDFVGERKTSLAAEIRRFKENQKARIEDVKAGYAPIYIDRAQKLTKAMREHLDALATLQQDARLLRTDISAAYEEGSATGGTIFTRAWSRACRDAGVPQLLGALTIFDDAFDGKRGLLARWRKCVAKAEPETPPVVSPEETEYNAALNAVSKLPRARRTYSTEHGFETIPEHPDRPAAIERLREAEAKLREKRAEDERVRIARQDAGRNRRGRAA